MYKLIHVIPYIILTRGCGTKQKSSNLRVTVTFPASTATCGILWHLFFLGIGQRSHLEVCSGHGTLDAAQKAVEVLRGGKLAWKVVAA